MEDSKTSFCSSEFPKAKRNNFFEIYGQFGHALSNRACYMNVCLFCVLCACQVEFSATG